MLQQQFFSARIRRGLITPQQLPLLPAPCSVWRQDNNLTRSARKQSTPSLLALAGKRKPIGKVIREDLQRQLWDAEYQLCFQSANEQFNAQKVACTSLHTDMLTKVVEHFKNELKSNVLDCYGAILLPGGENGTMASKAYQDMPSKTYQGVHPDSLDATIATKANLMHVSLTTLEGLLRRYGSALFPNGKGQQQTKQVATKPLWIQNSPQAQEKNDLENCKRNQNVEDSAMPSAMIYSLCKWLHFGKEIHCPKVENNVTNRETHKMGAIPPAVHKADTGNNYDHAQGHTRNHVPNPFHAPVPAPSPVPYPVLLHGLVILRKVPLQVRNLLARAVIERGRWIFNGQKTGVCTDQEGAHEREATKVLLRPMHNTP